MLCTRMKACIARTLKVKRTTASARTLLPDSTWKVAEGRAADLRRHEAGLDLHLQRAAVQDLLVEQFLAAHAHRAAGHLRAHQVACHAAAPMLCCMP